MWCRYHCLYFRRKNNYQKSKNMKNFDKYTRQYFPAPASVCKWAEKNYITDGYTENDTNKRSKKGLESLVFYAIFVYAVLLAQRLLARRTRLARISRRGFAGFGFSLNLRNRGNCIFLFVFGDLWPFHTLFCHRDSSLSFVSNSMCVHRPIHT